MYIYFTSGKYHNLTIQRNFRLSSVKRVGR